LHIYQTYRPIIAQSQDQNCINKLALKSKMVQTLFNLMSSTIYFTVIFGEATIYKLAAIYNLET